MSALVTTKTFLERKQQGEKITMLTAYDYPTAQVIDATGVDSILVGDSVGTVMMGYENTLSVTMTDMLYHTRIVRRAVKNALLIADMPFMSYQASSQEAIRNAGRLVAEGGAQAVKLEGAVANFGEAIRGILHAGIPVIGHLGLTPQSVHQFGGFKVQGRTEEAQQRLLDDALALEDAGCFAIVLECIPVPLAERITQRLQIPTIGIGAGAVCDGQVLVCHDVLGWGKTRFSKTYVDVRAAMDTAFRSYISEVKQGQYPAQEHTYS